MITLISAALVAAAPAQAQDAHAQHHQQAAHQQMVDCCKEMKGDCKECCDDMGAKDHADGTAHADHAHQ